MKEQERDLLTPYWQQDVILGEAMVTGEQTALHLLLHTTRTRFHGDQALLPLRHQHGICLYLQGQPAVLDPAIAPAIEPGTHPGTSCVGSVGTAPLADLRYRSIGAAQAWCVCHAERSILQRATSYS